MMQTTRWLAVLALVAASSCVVAAQRAGDELNVDLGSGVKLELVWIPPGEFLMGSPESEAGHQKNESPQHRVTISRGFWMGKQLVTQSQYEQVTGSNPSHFRDVRLPVEMVSWTECQEFVQKLNALGKVPNAAFGLPTEAQWEYACRAGTTTAFSCGASLPPSRANFRGQKTTAVGTYPPNAWGLCDMHGNLLQWCQDTLYGYRKDAVTDHPCGPATGHPIIRGGSWADDAGKCRSAFRWRDPAGTKKDKIGFRVVLLPQGS